MAQLFRAGIKAFNKYVIRHNYLEMSGRIKRSSRNYPYRGHKSLKSLARHPFRKTGSDFRNDARRARGTLKQYRRRTMHYPGHFKTGLMNIRRKYNLNPFNKRVIMKNKRGGYKYIFGKR